MYASDRPTINRQIKEYCKKERSLSTWFLRVIVVSLLMMRMIQ